MPKVVVKTKFEKEKLRKKVEKASFKSLGDAGRYTRGIAKKSIKISDDYAKPGFPPHSRKGRLPGSILSAIEREKGTVVVGPAHFVIKTIGHTHEFGGVEPPKKRKKRKKREIKVGGFGPIRKDGQKFVYARIKTSTQAERAKALAEEQGTKEQKSSKAVRHYPKRPFMAPALERARPRIPQKWANSVREF